MERTEEGTPSSIREHAAEWFLRLHAHDLNVAERFAYMQWLKASPTHIGETLQICVLYSILYPMKKQLFFTNEDDVSNVIVITNADEDEPGTRRGLGRRARQSTTVLTDELVGFGLGAVEHGDLVAAFHQVTSDCAAHDAEANEADGSRRR